MGHYNHKSILDAKFEPDSFTSFGDMTSQNFPQKEGKESSNSTIYPRKTCLALKKEFYVQNRSSRLKIDPTVPMSISAIFMQKKNFHFSFSKLLGRLDEKRAATTPLIDQFCKNLVRTCLRIKLQVTKFGHHRGRSFLIGSCKFGHPGPTGPLGPDRVKVYISLY